MFCVQKSEEVDRRRHGDPVAQEVLSYDYMNT